MKDVPVPDDPFLEKLNRPGDHIVTAMNLPGDLRPVLLHTWTDPVHGVCCRLLELSTATRDISDRLSASLSRGEVDSHDPYAVSPVIVLGEGKPISTNIIADRPVLISYLAALHPRLVAEGQPLSPIAGVVDERISAEWWDLTMIQDEPGVDYIERLKRLAETLTVVLGKKLHWNQRKSFRPAPWFGISRRAKWFQTESGSYHNPRVLSWLERFRVRRFSLSSPKEVTVSPSRRLTP